MNPIVIRSRRYVKHASRPARPLIRVHLQRRDERLLRDIDLAELAHLLLALLLLVEELALAGGVAAVAFGGDVLARGADRLAGDDLAAQGGLDGDDEKVGGSAPSLLDHAAARGHRRVPIPHLAVCGAIAEGLDMTDDTSGSLPARTPWSPAFPPVVIHSTIGERDRRDAYAAAKSGDADAALRLAADTLSQGSVEQLQGIIDRSARKPILLPITALETTGFNAIPDAMARDLSRRLGWRISSGEIVQINRVGHTRARSFNRLVSPAAFEGPVETGGSYVLVDDHVGLGGTLANLKGHIEMSGGLVVAMTTLTESRDGRHIALRTPTLDMLWERHGADLDTLWRQQFGHELECLTNVEGEILCRELSVDAIRDRLAQAAVEVRGRGLDPVFQAGGWGLIT